VQHDLQQYLKQHGDTGMQHAQGMNEAGSMCNAGAAQSAAVAHMRPL
jgi:hypothetical protein